MSQPTIFTVPPVELPDAEARQLLVSLLREAAKLEHCLLNTYLYAACSIRSTPQEFDSIPELVNARRAIQFERARGWKQRMLQVAQEEMRHLHYVQCLLRGLGEAPCFDLPETDSQTGNWCFSDWRERLGLRKEPAKKGVEIPLAAFSVANCRRFVTYESTDALQDDNPFGPATTALFEQLYAFESDLRLEGMLLPVTDESTRQTLKTQLNQVYATVVDVAESTVIHPTRAFSNLINLAVMPPEPESESFQSIADLYTLGIEPLYKEAFSRKWVVNKNRDLVNELMNPSVAAEGFLPVGPTYRDQSFQKAVSALDQHPLTHYKTVADIIAEIVEEGEGMLHFEQRAAFLLKKTAELGGGRAYWAAWVADKQATTQPTPKWLQTCEDLRQSHLYRFAMILTELRQEDQLARQAGHAFEPARAPLPVAPDGPLRRLTDELPAQFNACYTVMTMWLARMYEIKDWALDKPQRDAIEMLAAWPLMSMAIRPFLELASLLPIVRTNLFRTDPDHLPPRPNHARQLARLVQADARSQSINDSMDRLGLLALNDVADWAQTQLEVVRAADWPPHEQEMALARLGSLMRLTEFKKQFPFRAHGGYADRLPNLDFLRQYPNGSQFNEDPGTQKKGFADEFALRIRFAGQGLVQLATDPDPPTDEAGCTGTQMLHTADGNRKLNRAVVWQNTDPDTTIRREPIAQLPQLGVNVADVSLLVTAPVGQAGYVPLQIIQSMGAVQAQGVQRDLTVSGLADLLTVGGDTLLGNNRQLRVNLADKGGQKPYFFGDNHLVWKDGEAIDPFILTLLLDDPANGPEPQLVLSREVYNEDLPMTDFTPLQRAMSMRGTTGFGFDTSVIPPWAVAQLSPVHQQLLSGGGNLSGRYLTERAGVLQASLLDALAGGLPTTQAAVDTIVGYAERLLLIALPRNTTSFWLTVLCHYGHTISGDMAVGSGLGALLDALHERCRLPLQLKPVTTDRNAPDARWLVCYTLGMMDTDALSNVVYGDLYIPLTVGSSHEQVTLSESWTCPPGLEPVLKPIVARFGRVFWTETAQINGATRTWQAPDGTLLTETLLIQTETGYTYQLAGVTGVSAAAGSLALTTTDTGRVRLTWEITFNYNSAGGAVAMSRLAGQTRPLMLAAIRQFLDPDNEQK